MVRASLDTPRRLSVSPSTPRRRCWWRARRAALLRYGTRRKEEARPATRRARSPHPLTPHSGAHAHRPSLQRGGSCVPPVRRVLRLWLARHKPTRVGRATAHLRAHLWRPLARRHASRILARRPLGRLRRAGRRGQGALTSPSPPRLPHARATQLWDLAAGKVLHQFPSHAGCVTAVECAPAAAPRRPSQPPAASTLASSCSPPPPPTALPGCGTWRRGRWSRKARGPLRLAPRPRR